MRNKLAIRLLSVLALSAGAPAMSAPREAMPPQTHDAIENGQWAEAYRLTKERLLSCERRYGESDRCIDLLVAASNLARRGAPEGEDLDLAKRAVALTRALTGESSDTASAYNNLGLLLNDKGRAGDAVLQLAEALRLMRAIGDKEDIALVAYNLASVLSANVRLLEADAAYREALSAYREIEGPEEARLAVLIEGLAINLMRISRDEDAEPLMREAVDLSRPDRFVATLRSERLAKIIANQGRYDEAIAVQRGVLAAMVAQRGDHSVQSNTARNNLAVYLLERAQYAESELLFRQVLAFHESVADHVAFDRAIALSNLAVTLDRAGRHSEAEPLFRGALARILQIVGKDSEFTGTIRAQLGGNLRAQDRHVEAETELREAYRVRTMSGVAQRSDWIAAHGDLADILKLRPDGASEARSLYLAAEKGVAARLLLARSDRAVLSVLGNYRSIFKGHVAANWQQAKANSVKSVTDDE